MMTFIILLVVFTGIYLWLAVIYKPVDHSQFDLPEVPLMKKAAAISAEHQDVVEKLRVFYQSADKTIVESRLHMEQFFKRDIQGVEITPVDVNGIPGEWVVAANSNPEHRLLYLHGGSFRVGSPKSHRYITSELAKRSGVTVLAIDYRMRPEFKTIHCHHDARTAYGWMLENGPVGKSAVHKLFIAGDSAGGNLTLSLIAWARDLGLKVADGAIAMAPLTDTSMSSPTWRSNVETDAFLGPALKHIIKMPRSLIAIVMRYPTGTGVNNPMVSPLLGNLDQLPDTLIQVSCDEMLYADAVRYSNKANAQGSQVKLQVWPKLAHVFQGFGPDLPEAHDALDLIAEFIIEKIGFDDSNVQAENPAPDRN